MQSIIPCVRTCVGWPQVLYNTHQWPARIQTRWHCIHALKRVESRANRAKHCNLVFGWVLSCASFVREMCARVIGRSCCSAGGCTNRPIEVVKEPQLQRRAAPVTIAPSVVRTIPTHLAIPPLSSIILCSQCELLDQANDLRALRGTVIIWIPFAASCSSKRPLLMNQLWIGLLSHQE